MNEKDDGPVVIVTGAAGHGVGFGVCEALVERGARLVLNDVDENKLTAAAARWPQVITVHGDLQDSATPENIVATAISHFGHVDGLVNNAGVGLGIAAVDAEPKDFDRLFGINVKATWLMSKAFASMSTPRPDGRAIVNISSVHAQRTHENFALYAASKGAVESLTRGLAVEFGPSGIRCNAVAPGAVFDERFLDRYSIPQEDPTLWIHDFATDRQSAPQPVRPIDVGHVVAHLLSPESWAISGQTILADAGLTSLLYNRAYLASIRNA